MARILKKVSVCSNSSLKNRESCQDMTEQIRSKARELWEQKGRVQGKDLDIWLEAERIIKKR